VAELFERWFLRGLETALEILESKHSKSWE
jgi:hypothetical protein